MNTLRETLARLGELAGLATPGPWRQGKTPEDVALWWGCGDDPSEAEIQAVIIGGDSKPICATSDDRFPAIRDLANAKHIAAANPAVIFALVKQVEEMRWLVGGLKEASDHYDANAFLAFQLHLFAWLAALDKEI